MNYYKNRKIYLAGPDVFKENSKEIGKYLKNYCKNNGFEGLYPLDNEIIGETQKDVANQIFLSNFNMIKNCDVLIANISPFRGSGMDPGTAWEIGAAYTLGKKIYLYSNDTREYKERVEIPDKEYPIIENFGLVENLMINMSTNNIVSKSFEDALYLLITDIRRDNTGKLMKIHKAIKNRAEKLKDKSVAVSPRLITYLTGYPDDIYWVPNRKINGEMDFIQVYNVYNY